MTQKKLIIFDFDGTIADSFEASVKIFNEMAVDFGIEKITPEKAQELRDTSSEDFFRTLNVPRWRLPWVLWKARRKFSRLLEEVSPIFGIAEVLRELKRREYVMFVLTSNSGENIGRFLRKFNLEVFDEIFSGTAIFGKHKIIRKIIQKTNSEEVWCVGDETRDALAAKKAGVKSVAVSWGLNSEKALQRCRPDHLVSRPEELLEIFPDLVGKKENR